LHADRSTPSVGRHPFQATGEGPSKLDLIAQLAAARERIAALEAQVGGSEDAAALRASEERYRSLYNDIPLMYFKLDAHGIVLSVNNQGAESLGYEPHELVGQSVLKVFHPDHRERVTASLGAFAAQPEGLAKWEFIKVRKNGTSLWVHETVRASRDADGALEFLVVCEDVTERKEAERQILEHQEQLEALTSALALAEERERRRIGRGLHDEVAQLLALAKLDLGKLEESESAAERAEVVAQIHEVLDRTIQTTRTLIFELSSPVLYELGLSEALRELGEAVERAGVAFRFEHDGSVCQPGGETDAAVFRVARELVNNAIKHASPRSIGIDLATVTQELRVRVEDDGIGFDASRAGTEMGRSDRFGLFSIRQQIGQLGGRIEFQSAPGRGTRVTVSVPRNSTDGSTESVKSRST